MFEHLKLTAFTLGAAGGGLVAEVVAQAPPAVTWTAVALAAIGAWTLTARLAHSYAMARLETDRVRGENDALRAKVRVYEGSSNGRGH